MKKILSLMLSAIMLLSCFVFLPANGTHTIPSTTVYAADDSYIEWFTYGMTVKQAKEISPALNSFERNGEALSDNDVINTDDTVITDNGRYVAIVRGDIFGDGVADLFAYMKAKSHAMNVEKITDYVQKVAADANNDGTIDIFDCMVLKGLHFKTYQIPLPENATQVPVLLYHHILPDADKNTDKWANNDITIATSEFRRHLQMLKDEGKYVATLDEVVAYVRGEILLPPGAITLTFDDGYKSNTYYAAPILREFGYTATVFSIMCLYEGEYQSYYERDSLQHITQTDLEMNSDVFTQQCHTYANHNMLSEQTYTQIYNDLILSQECYHSDYFAFPYGNYDDEALRAVKSAGFKAAFSTNAVPAKPGNDIYLIPRITITSPMTDSAYLQLIAKAY